MVVCRIYDIFTAKTYDFYDLNIGINKAMYKSYEWGPQLLIINIEGTPCAYYIIEGKRLKIFTGVNEIERFRRNNELVLIDNWCIEQIKAKNTEKLSPDDINKIVNTADNKLILMLMKQLNTNQFIAKFALEKRISELFKQFKHNKKDKDDIK